MILLAFLFALMTFTLAVAAMTIPGWLAGTLSQYRRGLSEPAAVLRPLMGQRRRASAVRWAVALGAGMLSLAALGLVRLDAQPFMVSAALLATAVALFVGAQFGAYAIGWSQGRGRAARRALAEGMVSIRH